MNGESRHAGRAIFLAAMMVFSIMAAGVAFSGSAAAAHNGDTLIVDGDGTDTNHYATVQAALDNATDGDRIELEPGSYEENISISTANLTITSTDGPDSTIIDAPDGSTNVIHITPSANNVTVEGLTITDGERRGIFVGTFSKSADGAVIQNNKIIDNGKSSAEAETHGILLEGGNNSVVRNNLIANISTGSDDSAAGVSIVEQDSSKNSSNVTVVDNTIRNVTSQDESVGRVDAVQLSQYVESAVIRSNTIEDLTANKATGVRLLEADGSNGPKNFTVVGNQISAITADTDENAIAVGGYTGLGADHWIGRNDFYDGIVAYYLGSGDTLNATLNWWDSPNGPDAGSANTFNTNNQGGSVDDNVAFTPWLDASTGNGGQAFAPVTNDSGGQFASIQGAVDSAFEGTTVEVVSGTYGENVSVDTVGVTLAGPNDGTPGHDDSRTAEATIKGRVELSADNITLDGFDISPANATKSTNSEAILISGTADDVTVKNNIVRDFNRNSSESPDSGYWGPDGINVFASDSDDPIEDVQIHHNYVHSIQNSEFAGSTGISVQGNVNGATVSQNVVENIGLQNTDYAFGVTVRSGSSSSPTDVSVLKNNISGVLSDPASDTVGVGIGLESGSASNVDFNENEISNTELLLEDKTATVDLNAFTENNTLDRGALVRDAVFNGKEARNVIFNSIDTAVKVAKTDDLVNVEPGTYEESVTIDTQGITLEGPNPGTPGDENRLSAEAVIEQGVVISADGVTLDGFEVTNNGGNGIKVTNASSNVVITNNRVVNIAGGTAGDQKAFANGINLQFNDAFEKTSSGIEISNNEIHNITTEDMDSSSNDVIGIQILPRGNDVKDLQIADNVISDVEAGDASSSGRAEARGVSVDTQFTNTSKKEERGDYGQAKNLTIEDNVINNLTSEYSRAITLFEDKKGSASNRFTPIGPVNFTITGNTIDSITSKDPDGNVDASPTALFIGGYGELGDRHYVSGNNIEEGIVSRLLYGQVSPENADLLNAGLNWWGSEDGARFTGATTGKVATDPFLTAPSDQVDSDNPRQFGSEMLLSEGLNTLAFPAPSERPLDETVNMTNVEAVYTYDNADGSWDQVQGENPTPGALDVYVIVVEDGETAQVTMEFNNSFDPNEFQLGETPVSGGWNLVSPTQAGTGTADGFAVRSATIELTTDAPYNSPNSQPFGAGDYAFSPYRGYWTYVDAGGDGGYVASATYDGLTLQDYKQNANLTATGS